MPKLNMDTVREILLIAEEIPVDHALPIDKLTSDSHSAEEIKFHIQVMAGGGNPLLAVYREKGQQITSIAGPTWEGFQFLNSVRDTSRWENIKKAGGKIGDMSYETLKSIAVELSKKAIKEVMGIPES